MKTKIKTLLTVLTVAFVAAAFACPALAAGKPTVGYVNLEDVLKTHPALIKWNKELETLKAAREKSVEKQIKDKFGVTKETHLTDTQRAQVQQFIIGENDKFTAEMAPKQAGKMKKVEKDIRDAAAVIASEKKLDLVLDRMVVIYGGVDITADVIKKIKNTSK
ncbi:MAG: OmpH family outer membrane protein [bacterium]